MPDGNPKWLQKSGKDRPVRLSLYVQPGARITALAGDFNGALKIKISAPPVEGAANEAVGKFLAELLGIPSRDICLVHGAASRHKVFEIKGLSPEQIQLKLLG